LRLHRALLWSLFLALPAATALAQTYPKPAGRVSDFAHVLSRETADRLEADLAAFEQQTSIEIAVVTVTSLGGQTIESYTRGLATAWGVGKRGQDNGVVLLVAPSERKVRIQTATGVRSRLSDSRADAIRDRDLLPAFRAGDLVGGIVQGTHAIMAALGNPVPPPPSPLPPPLPAPPVQVADSGTRLEIAGIAAIAVVLLPLAFVYRRNRARRLVLDAIPEIRRRLAPVESLATNPDVQDATRDYATNVRRELQAIAALTDQSTVNWPTTHRNMRDWLVRADQVVQAMGDEAAFAARARSEGPRLMREMPDLIASAEKTVAERPSSQRAARLLQQARNNYADAQRMHAGASTLDWIMLYSLLDSSRQTCEQARMPDPPPIAEAPAFLPDTSSSSAASSGSDFGGGGGFDSGGGADSSGGGSSGSW
jgi:uncharacterized protein